MNLGIALCAVFSFTLLLSAALAVTSGVTGRIGLALIQCLVSIIGLFCLAGFGLQALVLVLLSLAFHKLFRASLAGDVRMGGFRLRQALRDHRAQAAAIAILLVAQVLSVLAGVTLPGLDEALEHGFDGLVLALFLFVWLTLAGWCGVQALMSGAGLAKELPGQVFRDQAMALRVKDIGKGRIT